MKDRGILLLPGGGMSSWIWKDIVPLLENEAICPDYRIGENTLEKRKTAGIRDCVDYLISLIEPWESVLAVGHSGAGILAASLAKRMPKKVAGVIFISANIPRNGESAIDSLPFLIKVLNSVALKSQVKKESTPLSRKAFMVKKAFCNTCNDPTVKYVLSQRLLSEPLCLAFEKVNWDDFPGLPQKYIILTKDKTQSVKRQKQMMKNIGIADSVTVDSDHMVMLSHPDKLAEIVNEFMKSLPS